MSNSLKSFYSHLEKISCRGVKPGLERMAKALQILQHPEEKLKFIHIAGTNGKGSTCSLLAQYLATSGYSVGLTLSPHVFDYRERIQYYERVSSNGCHPGLDPGSPSENLDPAIESQDDNFARLISEKDLLDCHNELRTALPDDLLLTYYEWSILLAIWFFSKKEFDVIILETGMGGRWDATNIFSSFLSGITTVGLDHMQYLGETKLDILREKQEIIKRGSQFLFGPNDSELIAEVKGHCSLQNASFHHADDYEDQWLSSRNQIPFSKFHGPAYYDQNLKFVFALGEILKTLGYHMSWEKFMAVEKFALPPARFQKISDDPKIYIDGAHNEEALKNLKKYMDESFQGQYNLLFGCLNDRDFESLAQIIATCDGENHWVRFEVGSRSPVYERENFGGVEGHVVSLNESLKRKIQESDKPVLVCGSLYLCSQFYNFWRC